MGIYITRNQVWGCVNVHIVPSGRVAPPSLGRVVPNHHTQPHPNPVAMLTA